MTKSAICFFLLTLSTTVQGGDTLLHLETANTTAEFTLGTTLHTVHGDFRIKTGSLHFDPASGTASGEVVADARSAQSGSSSRDSRMHREVLESEQYPDIVFRPDRVEGSISEGTSSPVKIHGRFSIHGSEHEVTVPAEVSLASGEYTVVAHIEVPYVKWGMKNPGNFVLHVNDTVQVTLHTIARPSPPTQ